MENNNNKLSVQIKAIVANHVFGHNNFLAEDISISLINLLSVYYELSEEESDAMIILEKWNADERLLDKIRSIIDNLTSSYPSCIRLIREYQSEMERNNYEVKRQYKGNVYKQHSPEQLFKDVQYKEMSYDEFYESLMNYTNSNRLGLNLNLSLSIGNNDKEIIQLTEKYFDNSNRLQELIERKAKAKIILRSYIYTIVKCEEILPEHKNNK